MNSVHAMRLGRAFGAIVLVSTAAVVGGCGLIGGFYGVFIDPLIPAPTVKAEHDMEAKRVLVWVDDLSSDQRNPILSRQLAAAVGDDLLKNKAARQVVDYDRVAQFRNVNPNYPELTKAELGRELGADEVLHITIDKFKLHHEAGESFYRTSITTFSKVVDAASEKHLWPVEQATRHLTVTGQFSEGQGSAFEHRLIRQLCSQAAEELAVFFYDHKGPK